MNVPGWTLAAVALGLVVIGFTLYCAAWDAVALWRSLFRRETLIPPPTDRPPNFTDSLWFWRSFLAFRVAFWVWMFGRVGWAMMRG